MVDRLWVNPQMGFPALGKNQERFGDRWKRSRIQRVLCATAWRGRGEHDTTVTLGSLFTHLHLVFTRSLTNGWEGTEPWEEQKPEVWAWQDPPC